MQDCKDQGLLLQIQCEDLGKDSINAEDCTAQTSAAGGKGLQGGEMCAGFMCSVAAPGIDAGGTEGDGVNLGCQNIADILESIQLNLYQLLSSPMGRDVRTCQFLGL